MEIKTRDSKIHPYMIVDEGKILYFCKTKKEAEERLRIERERLVR